MRGGEPMRCPNDGSRLVEVERADVLVDACPECRGIWLDRGELDKILVKERQLLGAPDDDFFGEVEGRKPQGQTQRREPGYEQERPRKKRRGLLEDLLDFD
jgi:uncharacterized protein